jgi:HEAT repeat protein
MRNDPGAEELAIAVRTLEQMEGREVDRRVLRTLRRTDEPATRVQLIHLLSRRNATEATNELLQQAAGPDPGVSIAAFQALKSLAGFEALPRLIELTKKCRDESTRDTAVNAVLGACKNSEDVDRSGALILRELKKSTVTVEKECWIRVLAGLGYAKALPTLTATLQDTDPELVQSTISHLSRWPDPAPTEALFNVLEGGADPSLRRRALTAILQLATAAADQDQARAEQLMVWFRRANKAVASVPEKRWLLSGLGRVKHTDSVRLAASYLDDSDVKVEAVHAILSAAEPLVKGPDAPTVEAVLTKISGIEDQRLLDRIARLRRDIKATEAGGNK